MQRIKKKKNHCNPISCLPTFKQGNYTPISIFCRAPNNGFACRLRFPWDGVLTQPEEDHEAD